MTSELRFKRLSSLLYDGLVGRYAVLTVFPGLWGFRHPRVFPEQLAVSDSKLANSIKDKLSIKCVNDSGVMELMRGIRGQLEGLLSSVGENNMRAMRLGLSHSLSRYKLKFSADKVSLVVPSSINLKTRAREISRESRCQTLNLMSRGSVRF